MVTDVGDHRRQCRFGSAVHFVQQHGSGAPGVEFHVFQGSGAVGVSQAGQDLDAVDVQIPCVRAEVLANRNARPIRHRDAGRAPGARSGAVAIQAGDAAG